MSGSYNQAYVKCPFFKKDDGKQQIACEGIVDNSSLKQSFIYLRDYKIHMARYCCSRYHKCDLYKILIRKYEEEGEE